MPAKKKKREKKPMKPAFTVRKATVKDLPTLVRQRRAMWRDLGAREQGELDRADKVYARWARSRMKSGTLMGWVAETGGKVLGGGCVWLQPVQPRPGYNLMIQPYLLSMYTEPRLPAAPARKRDGPQGLPQTRVRADLGNEASNQEA